jgi:hypothetical protein
MKGVPPAVEFQPIWKQPAGVMLIGQGLDSAVPARQQLLASTIVACDWYYSCKLTSPTGQLSHLSQHDHDLIHCLVDGGVALTTKAHKLVPAATAMSHKESAATNSNSELQYGIAG